MREYGKLKIKRGEGRKEKLALRLRAQAFERAKRWLEEKVLLKSTIHFAEA
jgi:hypothetical protein